MNHARRIRATLLGATMLGAAGLAQPALAAEGELVVALPTFSEQTMTP